MPDYIDQTGQPVHIQANPARIISLVPSQTELLADLGLDEEVIGITKFCIHPDRWFRQKTRIGGTKQLNTDLIRGLQPDLIIANKEENLKEQIVLLREEYPVWVSDIATLEDSLRMIRTIGQITNRKEQAENITSRIEEGFAALAPPSIRSNCIYLIWNNPYMTIGGDTFIHHMLEKAGFQNCFAEKTRYPEVSPGQIKELSPDYLLLSSEPFPFAQRHADELQVQLPDTKVVLVDGEMFSWYGSRLLKAPGYFAGLRSSM